MVGCHMTIFASDCGQAVHRRVSAPQLTEPNLHAELAAVGLFRGPARFTFNYMMEVSTFCLRDFSSELSWFSKLHNSIDKGNPRGEKLVVQAKLLGEPEPIVGNDAGYKD